MILTYDMFDSTTKAEKDEKATSQPALSQNLINDALYMYLKPA